MNDFDTDREKDFKQEYCLSDWLAFVGPLIRRYKFVFFSKSNLLKQQDYSKEKSRKLFMWAM